MAHLASRQIPLEVAAVCDLWSVAREQRAAQVKQAFKLEPKQYKYSEQMLANKDIDAVMIATGDFQHAKLCTEVVRAGKDCYVEKPFANDLDEAKEARDTVKQSKQVVQVGTQHRSEPYPLAVREIIRSGRIGIRFLARPGLLNPPPRKLQKSPGLSHRDCRAIIAA